MTEIIRHYRVDTGDKQKMNIWPSVSVRVDTDYPDSFRIIGRNPPQPFKRKFANQVLRREFEGITDNIREYLGDDYFLENEYQQYLPKEYDITTQTVHNYMNDPKQCGSDHIVNFMGYITMALYENARRNPVPLSEARSDYTYWLLELIDRISWVRDRHLSCDMLEEENPKLKIDRETFQITQFPW